MSFSAEVKEELIKHVASARHCQLAEIAAIISANGMIREGENGGISLYIKADDVQLNRKFFTILKKAFKIENSIFEEETPIHVGGRLYKLAIGNDEDVRNLLMAVRMLDEKGVIRDKNSGIDTLITKNSCCKRAFIRDTFICIGSVNDPEKSYHLEFVCDTEIQAIQLQEFIISFDIKAKIIKRKKYFVVYIKEGSEIVDLLNVMEAPLSLMNMENTRIVKEVRNSVNRRVNCEAANITKTVNAASKQTEDIVFIRDNYGFQNLPDSLREIAEVRLEYPEATLQELGGYLDPPVGKSGANHRLKKLHELAEKLRV
ncbi:MAG: DNA-binding protein WhiA [Butyrivibrio sp.]|nr:DNA-binding protein WhiA [Butyrivibrio sp.]